MYVSVDMLIYIHILTVHGEDVSLNDVLVAQSVARVIAGVD